MKESGGNADLEVKGDSIGGISATMPYLSQVKEPRQASY